MSLDRGYPRGTASAAHGRGRGTIPEHAQWWLPTLRVAASADGEEAVAVKTALHEVTERLAAMACPYQVRNLVRGNDPAEDIVDMVRRYDAELIVVGLARAPP